VTIIPRVIAGLDPAIHVAAPHVERVSMDHRVEPGGDELLRRTDLLRFISSQNVEPRGLTAQTPQDIR
jgi:hypothetical protein